MIKLTLTEKGGEPKVLTFDKDEITIGRVSGNDIVLAKGNISKRHTRLTKQDGGLEIADLEEHERHLRQRPQDRGPHGRRAERSDLRGRLSDRHRRPRPRRRAGRIAQLRRARQRSARRRLPPAAAPAARARRIQRLAASPTRGRRPRAARTKRRPGWRHARRAPAARSRRLRRRPPAAAPADAARQPIAGPR